MEPSNLSMLKVRREKARRLWFSVEKAGNLDARHSTVLLQENADSALANAVKLYFFGFTFIGTVAFANHYPWTYCKPSHIHPRYLACLCS